MKYLIIAFILSSVHLYAQPPEIRKVQSAIVRALVAKDSNSLKIYVHEKFMLVHADGSVERRDAFMHSYGMFNPDDALNVSLAHESTTDLGSMVIVRGTLLKQWLEGERFVRSKIPYADTYHNSNGQWLLVSSYINDAGENYYALVDTMGVQQAIADQYRKLDRSVQQKDLCTHLSLKTNDFSTVDQSGMPGSPQFMRDRSKILFAAMQDSIQLNNRVEKLEFVEDTVKAIVFQSFKRNQLMAGKVRRVESAVRQRESWLLTREGWKLVYVDQVNPLSRVVDGKPTDVMKPFNPN